MANEENLIPITSRPPEVRRKLGRMGGLVCSPKKKMAARLRELRKKELLEDKMIPHIWEALTIPEMSTMDIYLYLFRISKYYRSPQERAIFTKLMIEWHKLHHGKKKEPAEDRPTRIIIIDKTRDCENNQTKND